MIFPPPAGKSQGHRRGTCSPVLSTSTSSSSDLATDLCAQLCLAGPSVAENTLFVPAHSRQRKSVLPLPFLPRVGLRLLELITPALLSLCQRGSNSLVFPNFLVPSVRCSALMPDCRAREPQNRDDACTLIWGRAETSSRVSQLRRLCGPRRSEMRT